MMNSGDGITRSVWEPWIGSPAVPKNKTHLAPRWIDEKYENYTFIANHEQYLSDNLTWFANFGWRWEDYSKDLWGNRTLKDLAGNYTGSYQGDARVPSLHLLRNRIQRHIHDGEMEK